MEIKIGIKLVSIYEGYMRSMGSKNEEIWMKRDFEEEKFKTSHK